MRVLIGPTPHVGRNGLYPAHSEQDLDHDEVRELVRSGVAIVEGRGPVIETTMRSAPENMMRRTIPRSPVPEPVVGPEKKHE